MYINNARRLVTHHNHYAYSLSNDDVIIHFHYSRRIFKIWWNLRGTKWRAQTLNNHEAVVVWMFPVAAKPLVYIYINIYIYKHNNAFDLGETTIDLRIFESVAALLSKSVLGRPYIIYVSPFIEYSLFH